MSGSPLFTLPNDDALRQRVDAAMGSRLELILTQRGVQSFATTELDCASAAESLRDWWREHPGCVWRDGAERGDDGESFWDVERLLDELDRRAVDAAEMMAESRRNNPGGRHDG